MGLARLVSRRRGTSVVPIVVLGAAVGIGVVAVTASRFPWRRTKAESRAVEVTDAPTVPDAAPRFERVVTPQRWDTPPAALATATTATPENEPDPPSP